MRSFYLIHELWKLVSKRRTNPMRQARSSLLMVRPTSLQAAHRLTDTLFTLEPGPPSKLRFPTITASVVQVNWAPPERTGGNITQYRVSYRLRDDGNAQVVARPPLAARTRSDIIHSLSPEKYYVFEVQAYTAVGWGEKSSAEIYTSQTRNSGLIFRFFVFRILDLVYVRFSLDLGPSLVIFIIKMKYYLITNHFRFSSAVTRHP